MVIFKYLQKLIGHISTPTKAKERSQPKPSFENTNGNPYCLQCTRLMTLDTTGVKENQFGNPVQYLTLFCAKCNTTCTVLIRPFATHRPGFKQKKPQMVFDVYWGHLETTNVLKGLQ